MVSEHTSQRPTEDENVTDDGPDFRAEDIEVHDGGRLTIPRKNRDAHDIAHKDVVDVLVLTADGDQVEVPDAVVDAHKCVRIPHRQREIYGITDGERVTMLVRTTGFRVEE